MLTPRLTASSVLVGDHPVARLAHQREDVAEVVLALGVVVVDPAECVSQLRGGERVGAGVHLADLELLGGGVAVGLRLDDALEVAAGVADDAAVGAGLVEGRRHDCCGGAGLGVGGQRGRR